ncbi:MAG: PDGLE domain-containing protein [Methanotrichaceae archaeon]
MDKLVRNLMIGLVALVILTPLGLLATGTAYGEWGSDEIKEKLGFVPLGVEKLSGIWNAPLPDYSVSGLDSNIGYIIAAVLGVVICGGVLYFAGKAFIKD